MSQKNEELDNTKLRERLPPPKAPDPPGRDVTGGIGERDRILGLTKEYSGWDVYNNEAKKVDTELVKDWTTSLNFLLIFAAIFAAVLTAFIIESKKLLERDPASSMLDVMIFYVNGVANGTLGQYTQPKFEVPSSAITINCLFFASLSTSLFAALASVVSLQWVYDYDAAIPRGGSSPEDCAKRRQLRYAGVVRWKMSEIIAALPLLLYASVALFFSGLILWMYVTHHIVGLVVASGACIAALFYSASTILAVVFVSAPFRTPLSRWIYSLSRLPFAGTYILAKRMHIPSIPPWLKNQHLLYTLSRKREDRAIENRGELARDALIWLANQLSISQDSYRRVLLLVGELPSLKPEHMPSFDDSRALWYSIFDLLGWINLSGAQVNDVSAEETRAVSILQRCSMIPAVQQLVAPRTQTEYFTDTTEPTYWSQHCGIPQNGIRNTNARSPNHLYLLLRDVPSTLNPSTREMEVITRLSRWRNLEHKSLQIWKQLFNSSESFSPSFYESCIMTFSAFYIHLRTQSKEGERHEHDGLVISIMHDIMQMATSDRDTKPDTAIALFYAYEAIFAPFEATDPRRHRIVYPALYHMYLHRHLAECHALHEYFILLLSRQIRLHPLAERKLQVQWVVQMLYLRISNPAPNPGFDADPAAGMDWIKKAYLVPHIVEVLRNLCTAQIEDPDIGPLWRATTPGTTNSPHFADALETFDHLMSHDCVPDDHLTMVNLVCQDLERQPAPNFEGYFIPTRPRSLAQIRDPCLQALANYASGVDFPVYVSEVYRGHRKVSLERTSRLACKGYQATDSAAILQAQASLWAMFTSQREAYRATLRDSRAFHVFSYPVVCARCLDGPGHLFFHLLNEAPRRKFPRALDVFETVHLQNERMRPVVGILCDWYIDETLYLADWMEPLYKSYSLQLEDYFNTIKRSEHNMLTLIWNTASNLLEAHSTSIEWLAPILISSQKALTLPHEAESVLLLVSLSSHILRLREMCRGFENPEVWEIVSKKAINTSQLLLSSLATRLIFGDQNSRLVACARAMGNIRPAVGWLPPYEI